MNGAGAEREAISPEPDAGLELTDREIMTWAEVGTQPTEPPRRSELFVNKHFE